MSIEDQEILDDFVVEAKEHLSDIENQLLTIEQGGVNLDIELVNTVFRGVHSIKGAAGFLGLTTINKLAHQLENVLNLMRERKLVPDATISDVLLKAADSLRNLVHDARHSNSVDVEAHVVALNEIQIRAMNGAAVSAPFAPPTPPPAAPTTASVVPPPTSVAEHAPPVVAAPAPVAAPTPVPATTPAAPAHTPSSGETNIRVSVEVLDKLMNLAGELVLGRNQLLQTIAKRDSASTAKVAGKLDAVTSDLQEAIMKTRMQPVGIVFNKFTRIVRDLSSKLGKQCRLVIEGNDVETDKTIIEAIGDPLTHLVRNSLDHGLEPPDIRTRANKPAQGTINLRAFHQSGKVRIDIQDDGRGIDPERLKRKAVEKEIITAEAAKSMSDREAVRLIFHAGFSTAEKVTDVSGRGVGMDVVRTNIERIGGSINIESAVGKGTSVQITLPLTLAIIPSLVVGSHNRRLAIPQSNIAELVRIRQAEFAKRVGRVKDAEVLRLRGNLLPLVRLNDLLSKDAGAKATSIANGPTDKITNIIVVESGHLRYGLIVDALHDSEEIVVKPVGRHLKDCRCFSGATILGDGHVALILDVTGVATLADLRTSSEQTSEDHDSEYSRKKMSEFESLLMFTNHPQEHFAVPMSTVLRLERFRIEQIDNVGEQKLVQYRDSTLPLLELEELIAAKPRPESTRVYVAVFEVRDREYGLVIPELRDIHDVELKLDRQTFHETGVSGSQVIDGRTTRLLNVFELVRASHPEWFEQATQEMTSQVKQTRTANILLAEDSPFFRNQVKSVLESAGYQVVACEDGLHAWETLTSNEHSFDLVVTDVEMPRMTGLELSRKVRESTNFCDLPVIALTSLASSEDIRRGRECGISDYLVKMDREKLLASVQEHLVTGAVTRAVTTAELELVGSN